MFFKDVLPQFLGKNIQLELGCVFFWVVSDPLRPLQKSLGIGGLFRGASWGFLRAEDPKYWGKFA